MPLKPDDPVLAYRKAAKKSERAVYLRWGEPSGYRVRFDSDSKEETVYSVIPLPKGEIKTNVKPNVKPARPIAPEPVKPDNGDKPCTRIVEQGSLF